MLEIARRDDLPGVLWFRWQLQRGGESGLWWGGRKRGGLWLAAAVALPFLVVLPILFLALALDPAYRIRWRQGA